MNSCAGKNPRLQQKYKHTKIIKKDHNYIYGTFWSSGKKNNLKC